jgi:acyl-coenzyme A synthetase/AMP-(fatty) acid ligase
MAAFGKMYKHNYDSLRTILFAGEVFPVNNLKKLKELLPSVQLYNLYGPTETNVCTWFKLPAHISEHRKEPFPIGATCPFADYALVKVAGCRPNEGELWIAGDSVMNGYWNDANKTDLSFETDVEGQLWYRTGDVVSLTEDGYLQYQRRKDRMVKRHSYRIEMDEIEKHLRRHKHVLEAAVTSNSANGQTDTVITAHVVWMRDEEPSSSELLNYCNSFMPPYMLPDNIVFHKALPKTSTDKINYTALAGHD